MLYRFVIRPLERVLGAEKSLHIIILVLSFLGSIPGMRWFLRKIYSVEHPALERDVFGMKFKNPIGLAAGFDRYAHAYRELSDLGLGFVEVGTITPKPQPGAPRPRIVESERDGALFSRIGIRSHGLERAMFHLRHSKRDTIVGCNIGRNSLSSQKDAPKDYLKTFRNLYQYADYFAVNINCDENQNTSQFQSRENILNILNPLFDFRRGQNQYRPILLKISPDLSDEQVDIMTDIMLSSPLDGIVAVCGTEERFSLQPPSDVARTGDYTVSGKPLRSRALEVVRRVSTRSGGAYPIIGVGGINSADDAEAMLEAGATLIQVYSGFYYQGTRLIREISRRLIASAAKNANKSNA